MEAEAEKLKEMQNDVEKQMALSPPAGMWQIVGKHIVDCLQRKTILLLIVY